MSFTSGHSDLIDIAAELRMEKESAFALYEGRNDPDTGREVWVWVPKSLVEDNGDGTFTLPEWLAHEKGLI